MLSTSMPAPAPAPAGEQARPLSYHELLRMTSSAADSSSVAHKWWSLSADDVKQVGPASTAAGPAAQLALAPSSASASIQRPAPAADAALGSAQILMTAKCMGSSVSTWSISAKAEAPDDADGFQAAAQKLQASMRQALNRVAQARCATVVQSASVCFPGCVHLIMRILVLPAGVPDQAQAAPAPASSGLEQSPAAAGQLPTGVMLLDGQHLLDELHAAQVQLFELSLMRQAQGGAVEQWVYAASAATAEGFSSGEQLQNPSACLLDDACDDAGSADSAAAGAAAAGGAGSVAAGPFWAADGGACASLSPVVVADTSLQPGASALPVPCTRSVQLQLSPTWVASLGAQRRGLRIIVSPAQVGGRAARCAGSPPPPSTCQLLHLLPTTHHGCLASAALTLPLTPS